MSNASKEMTGVPQESSCTTPHTLKLINQLHIHLQKAGKLEGFLEGVDFSFPLTLF